MNSAMLLICGLLLALPIGAMADEMSATDAALPNRYARHERVLISGPHPLEVMADLNPAVAVSTLAVVSLKYFNRGGQLWVGLVVDNGDVLPGKRAGLDQPVIRDQHILRQDGSTSHRPTVDLELCIGHRLMMARLDLVERSEFTAPLVLGAPELKLLGGSIVDQKPTDPDCSQPKPASASSTPPVQ